MAVGNGVDRTSSLIAFSSGFNKSGAALLLLRGISSSNLAEPFKKGNL
jgi:hypothetical protein